MSRTKLSTCSQTTMQRLRTLRISRSSRAISLMIDGWMPSVGSVGAGPSDRSPAPVRWRAAAAGRPRGCRHAGSRNPRENRKRCRKSRAEFRACRSRQGPLMFSLTVIVPKELSGLRDVSQSAGNALMGRRARSHRYHPPDTAGACRHDADEGFHQCGLAHAVAAHERDDFARRDREIDAVKKTSSARRPTRDCEPRTSFPRRSWRSRRSGETSYPRERVNRFSGQDRLPSLSGWIAPRAYRLRPAPCPGAIPSPDARSLSTNFMSCSITITERFLMICWQLGGISCA